MISRKKKLNFGTVSRNRREYNYGPLMLLAFLFFLQLLSEKFIMLVK